MKITQIRERDGVETLSVLDSNLLIEEIRTEVKIRLVTGLRQALHFVLPGESCSFTERLPKVVPTAVLGRMDGAKRMEVYNDIVELTVGLLAGKVEVDLVRRETAELPQTAFTHMGAGGNSMRMRTFFTRPDGTLPQTQEEAEIFQAHTYRLVVKYYRSQIPFDIQLKEPVLEQYSQLNHDPESFYRENSVPSYFSQSFRMPEEVSYQEKLTPEKSPLNRVVPRYDTEDVLVLMHEAALRKTSQSMEEGWRRNDDLQPLVVRSAENCFLSGISEKEVVRRTVRRYYHSRQAVPVCEMIGNMYQERKGSGKKSGLTKEQYLSMQAKEFIDRRHEFHYNTQIGEAEYWERCSFYFRFRPLDKWAQSSILLSTQSEGIAVWNRDVDRHLHPNRVSVYDPLKEFIFRLPNWNKGDRITELVDRVPCANSHQTILLRRWFLDMVAHWHGYDRQHANSTSPLLIGVQGTYKSTFCRGLIPSGPRGRYTDNIDPSRKRDMEVYLNHFALTSIDESDQIASTQRGFLKYTLQKPVVSLRKSYSDSMQELRRYTSFIATGNQKGSLTDSSDSRCFMCAEVMGTIDATRPIDYEQLYTQAMYEICRGERYWFDNKGRAILAQGNREFGQTPPAIQLFYRYFEVAGDDKEGGCLLPVEILDYLQKRAAITLLSGKAHHFGWLLQKEEIPCKYMNKGIVYLAVKI